MGTDTTYLIVGASLSGAKAAEALRAAGCDGQFPDRPSARMPAATIGP